MGFRTTRTSDLSGADLKEDEVVTVVVRQHPQFSDGKVFDAAVDEVTGFKPVTNLVQLELRQPDGTSAEIFVTLKDFAAVVPDAVLQRADGIRGRRTGWKPTSGS